MSGAYVLRRQSARAKGKLLAGLVCLGRAVEKRYDIGGEFVVMLP